MRSALLSVLAMTAGAASAQDVTIPLEHYTLDNGLQVVLIQDRSTPIVHTHLWYHVGSKDETKGLTGFAHLFEHLMFQGSMNSPGEYFTPIQEVGGSLNGTTNSDRTNYFETMGAQYLPLALFMESDRMGNLLPVLDQGKLDNQREVVRNERRQRYENPPYGEVWVDIAKLMYPEGHPYRHPTIGSHEDLENASLDDVRAFFTKWYVPNNATLVVAGDFETAEAKALVQENFGWIPAGPQPVHRDVAELPPLTGEVEIQVDDVPEQRAWMAWQSPAFFAAGDAEMDVLASTLCDGPGSRLYDALVSEQKIARGVECFQYSRKLTGMFMVQVTAADGHDTQDVTAEVERLMGEMVDSKPVTQDELSAALANFEVDFYHRLETIQGKATMVNTYMNYMGDPNYAQQDLDRYLQVTPASVAETAKAVLTQPHVELHIRPEEAK